MPDDSDSYEIRVCNSCGLRYPLLEKQVSGFGTRCPACLGETSTVLSRKPATETKSALLPHACPNGGGELAALLDNIRSAWNVGSIFRSADGFGFVHVYLCGITPTANQDTVQKTSLGAEGSVPWSYHKDAVKLVEDLKKEGWKILALEEDERAAWLASASTAWYEGHRSAQREVLIVGNEVTGVDPALLDLCDTIYCIPMRGQKRSLNVAIAFGIAAYALT